MRLSTPPSACPRFHNRRGQLLLITVLTLGGTILGATTIAGLLLTYQIRQASDLASSGRAIYAADTGIEWGLFRFFRPGQSHLAPAFGNGATYSATCINDIGLTVDCSNSSTTIIRAVGSAGNVKRAFELQLQ